MVLDRLDVRYILCMSPRIHLLTCKLVCNWYESDDHDQFPKLRFSAKLGTVGISVYNENVTAKCVGRHEGVSYACRKCCITTGAG